MPARPGPRNAAPRRTPARPPAPEDRDNSTAVTLVRGLSLLTCFTPDRPMLSNSQFAALTGLGKSTVSRFCATLCETGYLVYDRALSRYKLGPAVLSLAYPLLAACRLRQIARGPMQVLADELGASVSIGVRDRLNIVYIETSRGNTARSPELSGIGMSHPMAASAIGRAYLAGCDPATRKSLINQIRVNAPGQFNAAKLDASLKEFRGHGFCCSFGDVRPQVHAVGVPFQDRGSGELFAFNCVLPSFALRRGELLEEAGPRLVQMVQSLSLY